MGTSSGSQRRKRVRTLFSSTSIALVVSFTAVASRFLLPPTPTRGSHSFCVCVREVEEKRVLALVFSSDCHSRFALIFPSTSVPSEVESERNAFSSTSLYTLQGFRVPTREKQREVEAKARGNRGRVGEKCNTSIER